MRIILFSVLLLLPFISQADPNCHALNAFVGNYWLINSTCTKTFGDTLKLDSFVTTGSQETAYRIANSWFGLILSTGPSEQMCEAGQSITTVVTSGLRFEFNRETVSVFSGACSASFVRE